MSENVLKIIPTDPRFRPSEDAARALTNRVRQLAPNARAIEITDSPHTVFVDAAANFESASCKACSEALDLNWWREQMDIAWESRFENLDVVTPCCSTICSLNDLDYQWPQGFARWFVAASDPNRGPLDQAEVDSLDAALSHEVRLIWAHL